MGGISLGTKKRQLRQYLREVQDMLVPGGLQLGYIVLAEPGMVMSLIAKRR